MFANNALLAGGARVRVWIREQKKDQKKIKGTPRPLMANLYITTVSLKTCLLQCEFCAVTCAFSYITGTKTQCFNLYYRICCRHGSTVSGIDVTSHWILVREVELLEAHFCHQVSVLHCSFLTWEQSSHNLLDSCGLVDPSFSLGIYAW